MKLNYQSLTSSLVMILSYRLAVAQQVPVGLTLSVLRGDHATHGAHQKHYENPMVKLTDPARRPISGAKVTFRAPEKGASATFKDGSRTFAAITGPEGEAEAIGFRPNSHSGQFNIHVIAEYQGQTVTTDLMQTNTVRLKTNKVAVVLLVAGIVGSAVLLFVSVQHLVGKR
jgi:hypothetical protein